MDTTTSSTATRAELVAALNAKLLREQNLPLALAAAAGTSLVGALLWMGITVGTGMHIGYVALGVGAAVGFAVRYAGKGVTKIFGVIGAVFTLLGCIAGETLAVIQLAAASHGTDFFSVLPNVDFGKLLPAIIENASPITYFIYAIGIYEGYKFSFRKLTPQEIHEAGLGANPTPATPPPRRILELRPQLPDRQPQRLPQFFPRDPGGVGDPMRAPN